MTNTIFNVCDARLVDGGEPWMSTRDMMALVNAAIADIKHPLDASQSLTVYEQDVTWIHR